MRRTFLPGIIAAGLIAAASDRAAAHHSFAAFDITSQKTVSGTIKQVDWTNPHIWIWMNVVNEKGGVDTYGFEGMSPNFLARRGWTKSSMKPGDKISIVYRPIAMAPTAECSSVRSCPTAQSSRVREASRPSPEQ
jgi:hypothetical protein